MCKKALAMLVLCFAVLGGCATNGGGGGDVAANGTFDPYDGSGPFPKGVVMMADG